MIDLSLLQVRQERLSLRSMALERRIAWSIGRLAFGNNDGRCGEPQVPVKFGAFGILHTVQRPFAAISLEMARYRRMPVTRRIDRPSLCGGVGNVPIEDRHDSIPIRDGQSSTGAEVVLHVNHEER